MENNSRPGKPMVAHLDGMADVSIPGIPHGLGSILDRVHDGTDALAIEDLVTLLKEDATLIGQEAVLEALRAGASRGATEPLYELWLMTRHPRLTAIISEENWIPDFPFHLKVFHDLEAMKLSKILRGGSETIDALVAALRSPEREIRERAMNCLENLSHPDAIDALCARWASDRLPDLERIVMEKRYIAAKPAEVKVLVALLTGRRGQIIHAGAEVAEPLIRGCSDKNEIIAARARNCLASLTDQAAIDAVAEHWFHRREPDLGEIIERSGYVASCPMDVRVLSALRSCKLDRIAADGPGIVFPLVTALEDSDPTISRRARELLEQILDNPDIQDALCRVALAHGNQAALEIAKTRALQPKDVRDCALLFFLTQQWSQYEALDFDMSLLREAYERGGKKLRERISRQARQAGRLELVELVAGVRHKRQMGNMTVREWQVTLGILEDRRDWDKMWRLAQAAPAVWAERALLLLASEGWSPEPYEQKAGFDRLVRLARQCTTEAPILGIVDRATAQFKAHGRRVTALLIGSYFESTLASASWDGTLRLWRMPDGELLNTISAHRHPVTCIAATPDASLLISGCGAEKDVVLWSMAEGKPLKRLAGHGMGVACLAVSPDGRILVVGCNDGKCRLWRLSDAEPLAVLEGHADSVRSAAFSPDGSILATGGEDTTVRFWSLPEGRLVSVLRGHDMMVRSLAFTPDSAILVSAGSDDHMLMWSVADRTLINRLHGHTNMVYSLVMSGDGRVLASGSWDRTVRLWVMPEGKPWGVLEERPGPVTCLATDPESRVLVSGSHDSTVTMWNFQSGIFRRPTTREDMERVEGLALAPADKGERNWLAFLLSLMKWRWRFDIEIDQGSAKIEVGEFDIEIGEM